MGYSSSPRQVGASARPPIVAVSSERPRRRAPSTASSTKVIWSACQRASGSVPDAMRRHSMSTPSDRLADKLDAVREETLRNLGGLSARLNPTSDAVPAGRGGSVRPPSGGGAGRAFKRIFTVAFLLIAALVIAPSTFTYVGPGHVGIVIHRAGGGVDKTPLGPGLHMRNPLLTAIEEYPTFMQTLVLTRSSTDGSQGNDEINVNSQEGQ